MADQSAHIALANRNQRTLNHLCRDIATHSPWIVTVAFYKALHIVEAVFFEDGGQHTTDHTTRFQALKCNKKYQSIYRHYSELHRASLVARYLEEPNGRCSCFDDWISPEKVASQYLFHRLKQIEQSAKHRLHKPDELEGVEACRSILDQPR